jgi:hypothetical protein
LSYSISIPSSFLNVKENHEFFGFFFGGEGGESPNGKTCEKGETFVRLRLEYSG